MKSLHKCRICGLHYDEQGLARECYSWCSAHDSCNLKTASQSVEAKRYRKGSR